MRKHWEPLHNRRKNQVNQGKKCSTYGCISTARAKNLCMNCYMKKRYHERKNIGEKNVA